MRFVNFLMIKLTQIGYSPEFTPENALEDASIQVDSSHHIQFFGNKMVIVKEFGEFLHLTDSTENVYDVIEHFEKRA
jgi:hypothetical protein